MNGKHIEVILAGINSKFIIIGAIISVIVIGTIFVSFSQFEKTSKIFQSSQIEWEGTHSFFGDDASFYETWCIENKGVWFDSDECRFEHKIDYNVAMRDLESTKYVKISGRHADQICDKMGVSCPENVVLRGQVDTETSNVHYTGYDMGIFHNFQIIGGNLYYKQGDTNDDWSLVITNTTRYDNSDGKYVNLWQFPGDELGYYESWCNVFDGDWLDKTYECGFKDIQDYRAAKKDLDLVMFPMIEGEQAEIFCKILHKECDERIVFGAKYDPRTDVTYYDGLVGGSDEITIRIIGGKISYANADSPENWIGWND